MGVSPAAGQGQCHPSDGAFRYEVQLHFTPLRRFICGFCKNCVGDLEMHEAEVILSVILNV